MIYNQNTNVSLSQVNAVIRKKRDMYSALSTVYYLPAFNSKACSKQWLSELAKENSAYFKIRNEYVAQVYCEVKRHDVFVLLQYLEDLLRARNLPPTGLPPRQAPNIEWLYKVILSLEPEDKLGILRPKFSDSMQTHMAIDPL